MKTKFKLEKPAVKSGGDRYVAEDGWTIYVPQELSRVDGKPKPELTITVE